MKKLSVGLPFRGQGKVQTKSWLLLLALGLLACMTMCLILVWSNIERIDTTYFINIAQNKLQERKALRAKLEVERERLLSPYELRRKAEEGVDVRVIYDGVGSAATLPVKYPDILHARGILCRVFQPLVPVLSIHQNNRDHRKITVIDGVTGYVSGLNLADEYVDRKERFGYWKDNALRLRGEATWSLTDPLSLLELKPVFDFIVQKFKAEEYGRVFVAFSGFVNTMVQKPVFRQLLPIEPEPLMNMAKAGGSSLDGADAHKQFLLEPSPAALLDTILPLYVFHGLVQIVLEARASEHSARMVAMKGATENAKNIIGGLTLDYNKARQTQITNELLEITTAMRAME